MMYYGERKTGCRFMEVIFHGCRSLIIENSAMRTMIVLDKGMNIISYVLKSTDTDFIWTNPMGLSCMEKTRFAKMDAYSESDNYMGGCFEIMPNIGGCCKANGFHFCDNAETMYLPWDYQVLKDSPEQMVFCFTVKLSKYPVCISKQMIVSDDSPALRFEEQITNIGCTPVKYQWGFHPCVGAPFLSEKCRVETPFAPDYSFPKPGSFVQSLPVYDCGGKGFASIRNTDVNAGFGLSWDASVFPYCAIWNCAGNTTGHHRNGGTYAAALLPMNTDCFGIDNAVKNEKCDILAGGAKRTCWYTMTAFCGDRKPAMIDKSGRIEFGENC